MLSYLPMILPFFSVVHDVKTSANNLLNSGLSKINVWATQWKMSFNPSPTKQAQEITFSRKRQNLNHDSIYFNHLDTKLNFQEHLDNVMSQVHKSIGLLRKLQAVLPCPSLVTIYKAFIRPHHDYGDIKYDQAYKQSFHQKTRINTI